MSGMTAVNNMGARRRLDGARGLEVLRVLAFNEFRLAIERPPGNDGREGGLGGGFLPHSSLACGKVFFLLFFRKRVFWRLELNYKVVFVWVRGFFCAVNPS